MPKLRQSEFGVEEIANSDLTLEQIPPPTADWGEIAPFGVTFNGYSHWGSFERCAEVANSRTGRTLTELRTCLFFQHRRHHHSGEPPDRAEMAYIRKLIEAIRAKVEKREFD